MELCHFNLETYIYENVEPCIWGTSLYGATGLPCFPQFQRILRSIALGLEFLHKAKEVHRDLKPRNGMFYGIKRC
jgi:serine/threonine protein kinase